MTQTLAQPIPKTHIYAFKPAQLLWLVLFVPLLPHLAEFVAHSWQVLNWDWQIDFDEGFNLDAAWKLAHGVNIYAQSSPDDFLAAPYPPLYYLLCAAFLKIFGLNIVGGRLISLVSSLIIGALLAWLIYRYAIRNFGVGKVNSAIAGLFGAGVWFSLNPTLIWSTFYKQDMLAIAMATGGLGLAWIWADATNGKGRRWQLWMGLGCWLWPFLPSKTKWRRVGRCWLILLAKTGIKAGGSAWFGAVYSPYRSPRWIG